MTNSKASQVAHAREELSYRSTVRCGKPIPPAEDLPRPATVKSLPASRVVESRQARLSEDQ